MLRLPRPARPVFYGWWIVAGGAVLAGINAGVYTLGFSAFILPLTEAFGVSRGRISLLISLGGLVQGGPMSPVIGALVDRFGARRTVLAGVTLLGLGFVLMSTAHDMPHLSAYFLAFTALGTGLATLLPAYAAAANWFVRRRSTAFGIINAGYGMGAVLVSGITFLIDEFGWRRASLGTGIGVWVLGYSVAFWMRPRPEPYGLQPDGAPAATAAAQQAIPVLENEMTARQALALPVFWLLFGSLGLRMMAWTGPTVHFIPAMADKQLSTATAAALLSAVGVLSVPSRLLFGALGDRWDKRTMLAWLAALTGVSVLLFAWASSLWQVVLFVVLFAIAQGGTGPLMMSITGEYFGRKAFGTIFGFGSMVMAAATFTGPILAGSLRDATGSYDLAFYIFAAICAAAAASIFLVRAPKRHLTRQQHISTDGHQVARRGY